MKLTIEQKKELAKIHHSKALVTYLDSVESEFWKYFGKAESLGVLQPMVAIANKINKLKLKLILEKKHERTITKLRKTKP